MKRRKASLGSWLKGAFTKNLGLKLLCFALAALTVFYQRGQQEEKTRTVEVGLNAQLPSPESARELMTTIPASLKLTVQGSPRDMDKLVQEHNSLVLDLRDGRTQEVRFRRDQFDPPRGVRIKVIDPAELKLEWQDVVIRELQVRASTKGNPAEGYEVASVEVSPRSVNLRGPEGVVRVAQYIKAVPFDVSGLADGTITRQLALEPAQSRTEYEDAPHVDVTVGIRRKLASTSYAKVPVEIVGLTRGKATPANVNIVIKGSPEVVGALSRELVVPLARIEVGDSPNGSQVVPIEVNLSGATAEVQPPSVRVSW